MGYAVESWQGLGSYCDCGAHEVMKQRMEEKSTVRESLHGMLRSKVCLVSSCKQLQSVQRDSSSPLWGDPAHLLHCCLEGSPPPGEAIPPTGTQGCPWWKALSQ